MTKKTESMTLKELREHSEHIRNVMIDNARTDTLVYGLLSSLQDDFDRGVNRKTLRKELQEAIVIAQEQFKHLFFDEKEESGDE